MNYSELNNKLKIKRRELQLSFSRCTDVKSFQNEQIKPFVGKKYKTLIIAPNEVNFHHGTGVLLNRIFNEKSAFIFRARSDYADKGVICSSVIPAIDCSRPEVFSLVLNALSGLSFEYILCVPYHPEDFRIAIAAKAILNLPLVTWIMDDNHLFTGAVKKQEVLELFRASNVCFAISPEMRDAYQSQFEHKIYMLPPVVSSVTTGKANYFNKENNSSSKTAAMVGNIWSESWLHQLLPLINKSGWKVDWFGRGSASEWLKTTSSELSKNGIFEQGFFSEEKLANRLASYPFVIVPTGSDDVTDDRMQITRLSLPTRLPFLLASVGIPILVLGSSESCSARFVRRFGIGLNCSYDKKAFQSAIEKMTDPDFHAKCRRNAISQAAIFTDQGLEEWIRLSSEKGVPADSRFEKPFIREEGSMIPFIDDPVPEELYGDFKIVFSVMRRLKQKGYKPNFVLDVGASTGVWSDTVHRIFPDARFVMVEPLPDRYPKWYYQKNPGFELIPSAASNHTGKTVFQVSNDLYGSSLLQPKDGRTYQSIEIELTTLNIIRRQKKIEGNGILKIDVQLAEHLVLDGAVELLPQVDFLILELTLKKALPEAKNLFEMIQNLEHQKFHYFDDIGEWRCPKTGILEQKDVIFGSAKALHQLGL